MPDRVIDLSRATHLTVAEIVEAAKEGITEAYMKDAREPEAILLHRTQAAKLAREFDREHIVMDRMLGIPLEIIGDYPRLIGGPLHGERVPDVSRSSFDIATYGEGPRQYVRRRFGAAGALPLTYWVWDAEPDAGVTILWRELLRDAVRPREG
jgi:hypothetical protein